jgi:hypothetical protein
MIYAPIIDSEIPAFYGGTLVVPYRMNPAVSFEDFSSSVFEKNVYQFSYQFQQLTYNIKSYLYSVILHYYLLTYI